VAGRSPARSRSYAIALRGLVASLVLAAGAAHAQLSTDPPAATALDTIRLRYTHPGCVNPDSVQVSQDSNRITVQVDRGQPAPDCGTLPGFYEEFTLGRLPAGEYDATLVLNPQPGAPGSREVVGPLHLSIGRAGSASNRPHDDYSDMWWNPREPGWALTVNQYTEKLFMVWQTYDESGKPMWLVAPGGAWSRDSEGRLHFGGAVYRSTGPSWQVPYSAKAMHLTPVGIADFSPLDASHAVFTYTVDNISGLKMVERYRP